MVNDVVSLNRLGQRRPAMGLVLVLLLAAQVVGLGLTSAAGVSLDLRGIPFLLILLALTATIDGVIVYFWSRVRGSLGFAGRLLGVVVISLVGAALALDLINRQEGFYASFSDLLGSQPQTVSVARPPAPTRARLDILTANWYNRGVQAAAANQGVVLSVRYYGERSRINRRGYLYLPAAYFAGAPTLRFPVIELVHGEPGGPINLIHQMDAQGLLDTEIAAHRMPPTIAVMAAASTGGSTECVDAVHGQANETYLDVDVPNDVNNALRVLPGRTWAIAGYSTGGFCSVNLALHRPDLYSAAASLSGYFTAAQDPNTLQLYGHSKVALRRNSPLWWVTHRNPVAPALFLFTSRQDRFSMQQLNEFSVAVRKSAPLLPTASWILPTGGHNWNVWRQGLRWALDGVARYLPMPLDQP